MEWYRNLRIVLSIEDKLPFLEQPIPAMPVPPVKQVLPPDVLNTHTAWVKASKEIAGLMLMTMDPDIQKNLEHLGAYDMLKELKMLYAQQADHELLQTVKEFHTYTTGRRTVLSLILVSLRKEYDGFVQNYNMHSMGKTVTKLHVMLKLHEQTLPPKEVAPALHAIRAGRIQKNQKKKSHKAAKGNQEKGKAKMGYAPVPSPPFAPKPKNPLTLKKINPAKEVICHQCGEVGHWRRNCPVYLVELMKKKKLSQGASTSAIKEPSLTWTLLSCACRLGHISGNALRVATMGSSRFQLASKSFEKVILCFLHVWKDGKKMAKDLLRLIHTDGCEALIKCDTLTKPDKLEPKSIKCIFVGYPKETIGYSFYYPPENKVFVARNVEFFENSVIDQEASGSLEYLEIIQEEDTHPSIDTSLNHEEGDQEIDRPKSDINPIRRSTRTRRPTDQLCLYVDAEEHELGDLGEPANYKATLLDPETDKWLNAMNVEMQSMRDNEVWELVDLPPNGKTVGHKWLYKNKTDMDGAVHTYKARLVAKGVTQTPRIDYEETFYSCCRPF
ncbi:zinc finger, CCHC-type containing protein [Tanacetum coccineum]|uniref:Zinc finger, CCHC-type containing protein n=1 Tax=Tanacetum coccineum TaxID=301880 RepID=A0ABQ4ZR00_9ASTR